MIAVLAGLVAAPPAGCVPEEQAPDGVEATIDEVLAAVGPAVVQPRLADFRVRAGGLVAALEAWRDAVDAGSDGLVERDTARQAWRDAMFVWQEAEVMQIGPAASSVTAPLGEDLRDEIYSWPVVNPCRVDQETVEAQWGSPTFFSDNLPNTYGLDAIEHLLWAGPDNTCPGQVPINADGSWDALGEAGITASRASYALATAREVERQAGVLLGRWDDGFTPETAYGSRQDALNALFRSLFYLESVTKDLKLAEPLGLGACTTECAGHAESIPSGASTEWIAANLAGFRALHTAGDDAGLDDLLRNLGHGALADDLLVRLDAADAAAISLGLPIDEALAAGPEGVGALHAAVKAVTDLLKGEVATALALQIPSEAAGDAD
ncbi:MAG: imelysin family protein [Myxococcota bacterium]